MKINDFLRMKITPGDKQFDLIKNIRFLDDKKEVLVGKGTTTVNAFCEAFFDFVYRNFSTARGAEKLIKQNRKKYTKFGGSENMLLVQKILNEISKEYAISTFFITCEMDTSKAKKAVSPNQPVAQKPVPATQAPVQAPVQATAQQVVQNKPDNSPVNESKEANGDSVKVQTLKNELGRMEEYTYPEEPIYLEPIEILPKEEKTENETVPEEQNSAESVNEVQNNEIPNVEVPAAEVPAAEVPAEEIPVAEVPVEEIPVVEVAVAELPVEEAPVAKVSVAEAPVVEPSVVEPFVVEVPVAGVPVAEVPVAEASVAEVPVAEVPVADVPNPEVHNSGAQNVNVQVEKQVVGDQQGQPQNIKQNQQNQQNQQKQQNSQVNGKNEHQGKHGKNKKDKRGELPDARMKPGKGIPPIKDLKSVPKFQQAAPGKGKLNIDEIPCIAVQEKIIVPTMEEVPFIGIEEDNSVPTMSEVPYLAVDEYGNPLSGFEEPEPVKAAPVEIKQPEPVKAAPVEVKQPEPVKTAPVEIKQPTLVKTAPVKANTAAYETKQLCKGQKDIKSVIASNLERNKQVIFSGPSGTGKTHHVRKYVRRITKGYDGFKFIQFHPTYEYADFIEGLRPANIINTNAPTNVRLDGVFKAFCRKIVEDNLEHAVPGFTSMYSEKKQKVVQTLYEHIRDRKEAIDDSLTDEYFPMDSQEAIFERGVREYYFVIDELNRAEVTKIFGDVLFALDEDYRGIENRFDTRLSNLKTYRIIQADDIGKANYSTSHIGYAEQMKFDCFEYGFFIPRNLHIVGTMNEIGSSLHPLDFAVKHRFKCIEIDTDEVMLSLLMEIHKNKDIFWLDRFSENLNRVNKLITEGFSSEYRIGPGYFKNLNESPDSIDMVFDNEIVPLLQEYLKGQPQDITERFIGECKRALKMGI